MELQRLVLNKKKLNWFFKLFFIVPILIASCTTLKNQKNEVSGGYKVLASDETKDSLYIPLHVSYYKNQKIKSLNVELLDKDDKVLESIKYGNISDVKIPRVDNLESIYIYDIYGHIKIAGLSYFTKEYEFIKIKAYLFKYKYLIMDDDYSKSELKILNRQLKKMKRDEAKKLKP